MIGIRANAVSVDKLFRARCRLQGCTWKGTEQPTYQAANAAREGHLAWHRSGAGPAEAAGGAR